MTRREIGRRAKAQSLRVFAAKEVDTYTAATSETLIDEIAHGVDLQRFGLTLNLGRSSEWWPNAGLSSIKPLYYCGFLGKIILLLC